MTPHDINTATGLTTAKIWSWVPAGPNAKTDRLTVSRKVTHTQISRFHSPCVIYFRSWSGLCDLSRGDNSVTTAAAVGISVLSHAVSTWDG